MSLRVGGLTYVICEDCGHRYKVKSIVPDDNVGLWLELRCMSSVCGTTTAMNIAAYRAYAVDGRRESIKYFKR